MDQSSRASYVEASAEASLRSAQSFIVNCRNLCSNLPSHEIFVEPVLTPRFVPTCSDELLSGLARLSRDEHVLLQSHMAESRDQVEWVKTTRGRDDIDVFFEVYISME